MSRNKYRNAVENISVPAGLEEKVVLAARRQAAERAETGPKRLVRRQARSALRAAVCAVCALALVLGNVHLRTAPAEPAVPGAADGASVQQMENPQPPLSFSFGLTACAADTGSEYPAREDGSIAFAAGEGMINPGEGNFTGCLFRVTGEEIASVSLNIDRGGLYRCRYLENLTDEEIAHYREIMGTPELATAAISMTDDGMWYMPEMVALGNQVRENCDPEARYGFWVPPKEMTASPDMDAETRMGADFFDGARLTITVTFASGAERTQVYQLHSGLLKVEWTEDHVLTVLPELAGEEEPCVYGVYAVPEKF